MRQVTPGTVPEHGTIAFDSVALVYFIEQHPKFFVLSERIFERIVTGNARGVASSLVFAELLVPHFRLGGPTRARAVTDTVYNFPNLECVEATDSIGFIAARLRADHTLRTPDAVHVATALDRGAEWFVTNDRRLRRVEREGIKVWLFSEHS